MADTALYTLLVKDAEDEVSVQYRYGPSRDALGLLRLDKRDKSVEQLVPPPGAASDRDFQNAVLKLYGTIRRGEPFPEETEYAA